jgi:hypothetical protein
MRPVEVVSPGLLEYGVGQNLHLAMDVTFYGVRLGEIGIVRLDQLKAYAIDGFGEKHQIAVKVGETLERP